MNTQNNNQTNLKTIYHPRKPLIFTCKLNETKFELLKNQISILTQIQTNLTNLSILFNKPQPIKLYHILKDLKVLITYKCKINDIYNSYILTLITIKLDYLIIENQPPHMITDTQLVSMMRSSKYVIETILNDCYNDIDSKI